MDNPAGPVISETMIDARLNELHKAAVRQIDSSLDGIADQVKPTVQHLINDAYKRGLVDGFAQRVFADNTEATKQRSVVND